MSITGILDRRTRYKRPRALLIAGIGFLLMPFYNYYFLAHVLDRPLDRIALNLAQAGTWYTLLMLASFVVGIGLLAVQKWGWWAAMIYSSTLIVHNTYTIVVHPAHHNFDAIAQTVIATILLIYFGSKDISAPYFKVYPRGWRLQFRSPVRLDLRVNDIPLKTLDFSPRGFYVEWTDHDKNPGDAVEVVLATDEGETTLTGGVVRVDAQGTGIAFRGLKTETRRRLKRLVRASMTAA